MNHFLLRGALILALFFGFGGSSTWAATLTVTTTANSGTGSLRSAITLANASPGSRIIFNIPGSSSGGPRVIAISSALPEVTANGTVIDGSSQTSYINCNPAGPDIAIDSANNDDLETFTGAISIYAANCTVSNLMFTHYAGTAIYISNDTQAATGNTVKGCWFGLGADGKTSSRQVNSEGNGPSYGVKVYASSNTIGGTSAADRNIFVEMGHIVDPTTGAETMSFRGYGVYISGDDNTILNNYFGVGVDGTTKFKNCTGIGIQGKRNLIGQEGAGNIFGGAEGFSTINGAVSADRCTGTQVVGNSFGVGPDGTTALGKLSYGLRLSASGGSLIGGSSPIDGNVFSNCVFAVITSADSDNLSAPTTASFYGNFFGVNRAGTLISPCNVGIDAGTNDETIGGTTTGLANTFKGCALAVTCVGMKYGDNSVFYPNTISIRGNVISDSTELGIDLAPTGENAHHQTPNDVGDADNGPNGVLNYPEISSVEINHNGKVVVSGSLNTLPGSPVTLDFYANSKTSVTGYGEGERYLGSTDIFVDAYGNASFKATLAGVVAGENVAATSNWGSNITSEFCKAVNATVVANRTPVISNVTVSPNLRQTNNLVTAAPIASDADADALTFTYVWKRNGAVIAGETSASLDLSKTGRGEQGDVISVIVTASDGLANSSTFQSNFTVDNSAPILNVNGAFRLNDIAEDDSANSGTLIEDILSSAGAGALSDADISDAKGIALATFSAASVVSRFEFSLDNGATWTTLSISGTRLLAANGKTRLRLIPTANTSGDAHLYFYAWDGTQGTNGGSWPTASRGGTFPLSQDWTYLTATVTPVDDAPQISGVPTGITTDEDASATQFNVGVTDIDSPTNGISLEASTPNPTLFPAGNIQVTLLSASDASPKGYRISFTPAPNQNGQATITLTARSGNTSSSSSFVIIVNAVNDAPTLSDPGSPSPLVTPEDTDLTFSGPLAADGDATDTFVLTGTFVGGTGHFKGSTTFAANISLSGDLATIQAALPSMVFRPDANFNGTASVTFTLNDGTASASQSFEIAVTPVNDVPTMGAIPDQAATVGQTLPLISFAIGDIETAPDALNLAATSSNTALVSAAGLILSGSGADRSLTITPIAGMTGTTIISLTVKDADGATFTRTFKLTVSAPPVNQAPVIVAPATVKATEDKASKILGITVSDADAGTETLKLSWTSSHGITTLDGLPSPVSSTLAALNAHLGKGFSFLSDSNFNGGASLKITLDDGGNTGTGGAKMAFKTVVINTAAINDAPTMAGATFTGKENKTLSSQLRASDIDGDKLSFKVGKKPANGTLTLQNNGAFTYVPKVNWNGTDSFTATATDPEKLSATATFTLKIAPVNLPPVAVADSLKGIEDIPLTIAAATLLKNDSNGELSGEIDPLKIAKVTVPSGFPGVLKFDKAKQRLLFTPKANWNGETYFTYWIQDSGSVLANAKVTLQFAAVNDAPIPTPTHFGTSSGVQISKNIEATDVDGDALTLAIKDRPKNGTATISLEGSKWVLKYSSSPGFVGVDNLSFTARDAKLISAPATVSINVTAGKATQNLNLSPNSGQYQTGSEFTFTQQVRDKDELENISAVALLLSNSPTIPDAKNSATLWFDPINSRFTLGKDDGLTYFSSTMLGQSLENSHVIVTLSNDDISRQTDGSITIRWHIIAKTNWAGVKTLWTNRENSGGAGDGFKKVGSIEFQAPVNSSGAAF